MKRKRLLRRVFKPLQANNFITVLFQKYFKLVPYFLLSSMIKIFIFLLPYSAIPSEGCYVYLNTGKACLTMFICLILSNFYY